MEPDQNEGEKTKKTYTMKSDKQTEIEVTLDEFARVLKALPLSPLPEMLTRTMTTTTMPEIQPTTKHGQQKERCPPQHVGK